MGTSVMTTAVGDGEADAPGLLGDGVGLSDTGCGVEEYEGFGDRFGGGGGTVSRDGEDDGVGTVYDGSGGSE